MSASAPLGNELRRAVEERFHSIYSTTVFVFQAWGLTETSPGATVVPPGRKDKAHTVGCVYPNMEFRVVDPKTGQDAEVAVNGSTVPGEIWCRGPNVDEGDPWFKTGDVGTFDKDGYLTIVDRIKEMIKYKGFQVIPSGLEGILLQHPDVADAGVVGVWVEKQATELPVAFIVPSESGKRMKKSDLMQSVLLWYTKNVANYKKLRGGLYVVDAISRNPSGKILRRQLKETRCR
ncbi:hypothetical protein EDB80DRAFT_882513 [Ilyonectria destructans]|nr:hypothetical protein EDB80DRAFT_882513 [Ilyonectria destructans]